MYKWRPILEGITTLHEVNTYWDICDLADANEIIDVKEDAQIYYHNQAARRNKSRK